MMLIPSVQFEPATVLDVQGVDMSSEFIKNCGADNFHIEYARCHRSSCSIVHTVVIVTHIFTTGIKPTLSPTQSATPSLWLCHIRQCPCLSNRTQSISASYVVVIVDVNILLTHSLIVTSHRNYPIVVRIFIWYCFIVHRVLFLHVWSCILVLWPHD